MIAVHKYDFNQANYQGTLTPVLGWKQCSGYLCLCSSLEKSLRNTNLETNYPNSAEVDLQNTVRGHTFGRREVNASDS